MRLRRLAGAGFRFLVVGGVSTLIEVGIFNACYLGLGWDPVVAKVVASLVALVNAYFGNRRWTFGSRRRGRRSAELALFLATNVVCAALGALIVAVGVAAVGNDRPLVVNAINLASIVVVVLVRFALYYGVVFREGRPVPEERSVDAP